MFSNLVYDDEFIFLDFFLLLQELLHVRDELRQLFEPLPKWNQKTQPVIGVVDVAP